MISTVHLENFRGHTKTSVPLQKFTLLVGDNGFGKTSVLSALSLLHPLLTKTPHTLDGLGGSFPSIVRKAIGEKNDLAAIEIDGYASSFRFRVRAPDARGLAELGAAELFWKVGQDPSWDGLVENRPKEVPSKLLAATRSVSVALDPRALARPSLSDDEKPQLQEGGYGLPTVLKELKCTETVRYAEFVDAVRTVLPNVADLSFRRVRLTDTQQRTFQFPDGQFKTGTESVERVHDSLLIEFRDAGWLPASVASEGTLMVLGLLATMHTSEAPGLVLIDDIDRGLHPRAQAELVTLLRKLLEAMPATQIVATTHSPYLVDSFTRDEVVVLARNGELITAQALSSHPEKPLAEVLSTGEFLVSSGKDWFGL